ncbi:cation transporter [Planctomycetes bacterium K23_9]|uniref:Cation efflux family protein n=1 Tax=Stieleria marina TaxID=1930275 RepID=A0A517P0J2_9BACT|nr:Cation efflux family protein [Planctomycetes bacterium K23_9]
MPTSRSDRSAIEQRSFVIGKWTNLLMAVLGVGAAYASHSDALLVDGLYSAVNFVSAIVAARISASVIRPADRRFPFGYDAHEALYVKYRALILLGITSLAIFSAISRIAIYATGGHVEELVFGPILIYTILMTVLCFGLSMLHYYDWHRSGRTSELLMMESKAAIIDGIISVAAGSGLLGAMFLRGTMFQFLVPISDSIIVLIVSIAIIGDPVRMFLRSLTEVAGGASAPEICSEVESRTRQLLEDRPFQLLDVAVAKIGRSYLIISYVNPDGAIHASQVDELRHEFQELHADLLGEVKTELMITAEHPFQDPPDHQG